MLALMLLKSIKSKILISIIVSLFACDSYAGITDDLKSPVTTDAKWILIGGTAMTLLVVATQDSFTGPWETWTARNKPLGKYSKYGDQLGQLIPNAVYTIGMGVAYWLGNEKAYDHGLLMVEATAYASLLSTMMKYNVAEGRPYDSETGSSFPSGHSTTAFSFAGVVAAEHGWYYGVPAMMMAGFVGYSRINDNMHRTHDVTAGATLGLACAFGIHYSHKALEKTNVRIWPTPVPGGAEVVAHMSF